jgi:hypothetical protein
MAMLFRHLNAEDFTNLLEGTSLPDHRRAHLQSCAQCLRKFRSIQEVRNEIEEIRAEDDEYIPEPDWAEFRSEVRNTLLSRSIQRENAARSWILRPATAWGFSMALAVAVLVISGVLWSGPETQPETATLTLEEAVVNPEEFTTLAAVSQPDALGDLLNLNADEAESLRRILDDVAKGVSQQ